MAATRELLYLAYRDVVYERRLTLCQVLALLAVLAPLLILFALKFGLIDTLTTRLLTAPANREVIAVGSRHYEAAWFAQMAARPDVAFIVPNTRRISASLSHLHNPASGRTATALQMIPTAAGDPLLTAAQPVPQGMAEIVLSASAARALDLTQPGPLIARIDRTRSGQPEFVTWTVRVVAILPAATLSEDAALVPLELLIATEDYRDGVAVAALGWSGTAPAPTSRQFARFRLYAASLNDVARLEADLTAEGISVRSQLAEIAALHALDRNLGRVFWLIAALGLIGLVASLAASLVATVERKQRELSIIRLIGFPTASLILYPVAQAVLIATAAALAALLLYWPLSMLLNTWFAASLRPGEAICRLLPQHILLALAATLIGAVIAAAWAGWRAARIEPAEGVRNV